MSSEQETLIRTKFQALEHVLNEATTRLWAATEATVLGRGGIAIVARATGLARNTIVAGIRDLQDPERLDAIAKGRIRRQGAGPKPLTEEQPGLLEALDALISPATRGDPMSPLRWTSKSTEHLASALKKQGFRISADTVGRILVAQGYSLQAPRKTLEGGDHPDRDAQFQHIATKTEDFQEQGFPVISVDCKKKELVGDFKNGGQEWQPKGQPEAVNVYDFVSDALFKAIPYGIYDVTRNEGWVNVGISHDTAEFAVASIWQWWKHMGRSRYPEATKIYITADGGGSNGSINRLWKKELQKFSNNTGLEIHVSHLPPGTSKWNKIEHRMFGQITMNWRGRPLTSLEVLVSLIGGTKTETGWKVKAKLDEKDYPTGKKVTNEEMEKLNLEKEKFHGEWNYTIKPGRKIDDNPS